MPLNLLLHIIPEQDTQPWSTDNEPPTMLNVLSMNFESWLLKLFFPIMSDDKNNKFYKLYLAD